MCTVVILRRPNHAWPVIIGANRDEMAGRPWSPPSRHWADRPDVTAGKDDLAGGTWLGINDYGVVAGVLNRKNSLGPAPGMRSRGELPLEALDHAEATAAAEALSHLDPASYRPFNMVIADCRKAYWLSSAGGEQTDLVRSDIEVREIPEGLSMTTAYDLNDLESPRMRYYLPKFEAAAAPEPESGDWSAWQALMGSRQSEPDSVHGGAMNVMTDRGFGTVSSSLMALPEPQIKAVKPVWLFASGRPDEAPFEPVIL